MKTPEEWLGIYKQIGEEFRNLPTLGMNHEKVQTEYALKYIKSIQMDALKFAMDTAEKKGDSIGHGFGELTDSEMWTAHGCYAVQNEILNECKKLI